MYNEYYETYPTYTYTSSENPSNMTTYSYNQNDGDRLIGGGFAGPFILGGITGGLLAPAFYRPRPYYRPYYPPYYGHPYYRPPFYGRW